MTDTKESAQGKNCSRENSVQTEENGLAKCMGEKSSLTARSLLEVILSAFQQIVLGADGGQRRARFYQPSVLKHRYFLTLGKCPKDFSPRL